MKKNQVKNKRMKAVMMQSIASLLIVLSMALVACDGIEGDGETPSGKIDSPIVGKWTNELHLHNDCRVESCRCSS